MTIARYHALLFLLIVAITTGCASQGEKMVQSYSRTRESVLEAQNQVRATVVAMNALRSTPPAALPDAFGRYKDAVSKLEREGADAKRRSVSMKEEMETHIRAWQKEMETIKDPSIKASLESRREAVRTNFKLVQMYSEDARKAYEPFLQGSQSIVQALSIDLSPAALDSLAPSMDRVAADGNALSQRISAIQRALDNIANGISPIGEWR